MLPNSFSRTALSLAKSPRVSSRTFSRPSSSDYQPDGTPSSKSTASSFLARQAQLEEEEQDDARSNKAKRVLPELREPVWDGEETRERMLQRIMQDQYKPLRIKGFTKSIPQPAPLPAQLFPTSRSHSQKDIDRDRATSGGTPSEDRPKQPWEYDRSFKPPDHYQPALGYRGYIPSSSSSLLDNSNTLGPRGERRSTTTIKKSLIGGGGPAGAGSAKTTENRGKGERTTMDKRQQAQKLRIFDAYEKTLDYRGGLHKVDSIEHEARHREDPSKEGFADVIDGSKDVDGSRMAGEMRVYEGFIEEKIKKAREQGLFKNIKGRGKPIPKDDDESNPFISRDDFLINRILKTQDAAPPWIELQKELEHSLSTFRSTLSSTWIRRAIRIRSSEGLTRAVITEIEQGWRDPDWEHKEKKYHETAVKELNDLTRRFNIIAPYHVRRPLLSLASELSRTVSNSSSHIATELSRRLAQGLDTTRSTRLTPDDGDGPGDDDEGVQNLTAEEMGGEKKAVKETMFKAFRRVLVEILGKGPDDMVSPPRSTRTNK